MHQQLTAWAEAEHEYAVLRDRLRDEDTARDYTWRNGVLLGFVGGSLLFTLIYAVATLASWVTR